MAGGWIFGFGCGQDTGLHNDLNTMKTGQIVIKGTTFKVWLALTVEEHQLGLMQTPESALAPIAPDPANGLPNGAQRGMLFVFPDDELQSFWMSNTIIPLDIAYIRSDGVIMQTYTMAALETRTYPSVEPVQFALEMRAGLLSELGIAAGDKVEIPETILKGAR